MTRQDENSGNAKNSTARGLSIEIAEGTPAFLALRSEWNDLHDRAALPHHVFQSHSFLRHWAEHYLDSARIVVVCGRVGGRLAMAWPLTVFRKFGVDVASFMGAPTAQFFDVLVDGQADVPELLNAGWQALSQLEADIFVASNIRDDSRIRACSAMLPRELPGRTTAPYANLSRRVQGPEPGTAYSARERSNYRRRLRRAEEEGPLSFGAVECGPAAADLARRAVEFKQRSLWGKGIWSPTVSNPRFGQFFEAIAADPEASLRVSTMTCGGREVGIELSFDCRDHAFGHVLSSDPDSAIEGIGSILVLRTFIAAKARGMHTFEMMAPADRYKMPHADGKTGVSNIAVALSPKGKLYRDLYLRGIHPVAKAFAQRFAAPLVARLLQRRHATD
jgi:CelD/BcsL family acetyltransferase involved in cellulose biosynthesis